MITKIKTIRNMAVFNAFDWDDSVLEDGRPILLKQVNVIYGRNYSGKTTLSRIIRAYETGQLSDKYENPSFEILLDDGKELTEQNISESGLIIRVFNEDFIRDNLKFVVDPGLDVVPFAILGKDNTRIEAEIAGIKERLGSGIPGEESGLYAEQKTAKKVYFQAKKALDLATDTLKKQKRSKATDQKVGIKYQVNRFNVQNYNIRNLDEDIEMVLSNEYVSPSDDEITTLENTLVEQYKPIASNIIRPSLRLSDLASICKGICEKRIGSTEKIQELMRNAALEQWVKVGMTHNEGREVCAFCGQPLTENRWDKLRRHFDEETEKLSREIDEVLKQLEDERRLIEAGFNPDKNCFYAVYIPDLDNLILKYEKFKRLYNASLDVLSDLVQQRKLRIHQEIAFEYLERNLSCEGVFDEYRVLQEKNNEYGEMIALEKAMAQKALRYVEVDRFLHEIDYEAQMANLTELEEASNAKKQIYDSITRNIISLEQAIVDKRRLLNDEEKGALKVNALLSTYFKHKYLSLQAVESDSAEGKKIHFEVVRNGKKAFHLSEGECSLIAFCYFVAKLYDVETLGRKPIIWIDDPISSLDGNHIYFVYSVINQQILAKDIYDQLFITTHNLQFLKYLRVLSINNHQREVKGVSRTNLLIERRGENAWIVPMPKYLRDHGTEFNHWFECIYNCANMVSVSDENVYLFESFGNIARKFLETYLYYRYPDKDSFKNHLDRFFGEDGVPPIIVRKVSDEMSHGDGDLENHDIPFDEPEVMEAAKLLVERLKIVDEDQYNALLSSIQ